MPDVFTPLLILTIGLLAWVPERLSRRERVGLTGLAAFMIASQQSSLPLACVLLAGAWVLIGTKAQSRAPLTPYRTRPTPATPDHDKSPVVRDLWAPLRQAYWRWPLIVLPPALALLALCSVNFASY